MKQGPGEGLRGARALVFAMLRRQALPWVLGVVATGLASWAWVSRDLAPGAPWTTVAIFALLSGWLAKRERSRVDPLLRRLPLSVLGIFATRFVVYLGLGIVLFATSWGVAWSLEVRSTLPGIYGGPILAFLFGLCALSAASSRPPAEEVGFVERVSPLFLHFIPLLWVLLVGRLFSSGRPWGSWFVGFFWSLTLCLLGLAARQVYRTHLVALRGQPPYLPYRRREGWGSRWSERLPSFFVLVLSFLGLLDPESLVRYLVLVMIVADIVETWIKLQYLRRQVDREKHESHGEEPPASSPYWLLPRLVLDVFLFGALLAVGPMVPEVPMDREHLAEYGSVYLEIVRVLLALLVVASAAWWSRRPLDRWRHRDPLLLRLPLDPRAIARERRSMLSKPLLGALAGLIALEWVLYLVHPRPLLGVVAPRFLFQSLAAAFLLILVVALSRWSSKRLLVATAGLMVLAGTLGALARWNHSSTLGAHGLGLLALFVVVAWGLWLPRLLAPSLRLVARSQASGLASFDSEDWRRSDDHLPWEERVQRKTAELAAKE